MPETTLEAKAAAERERATRRRAANERLAKLPPSSRDAVNRDALRREADHKAAGRPRVTAVTFLEQALDAFEDPTRRGTVAAKAVKRPGTDTGDRPRPKGPREKSTPKEKGRPEPETKTEDLADAAKAARGGDAALQVVVSVEVPDGTAYCKSCDTTKPEAEFWPKVRTEKSKRRGKCRTCFNAEWKAWDEGRRAASTA